MLQSEVQCIEKHWKFFNVPTFYEWDVGNEYLVGIITCLFSQSIGPLWLRVALQL